MFLKKTLFTASAFLSISLALTTAVDAATALEKLQLQAQQEEHQRIVEKSWYFSKDHKSRLLTAKLNEAVLIPRFPQLVFTEEQAFSPVLQDIKLTRYELMAPGAKIIAMTEQGEQVINPQDVLAFSGAEHGLGLLVDRKSADVTGLVIQDGISFSITGNLQTGLDFRVDALDKQVHDASNSCSVAIENQPGDPLGDLKLALKSRSIETHVKGAINYEGILAIDTDNEWMDGKSDNVNTAMTYINTLFVNMNVYYERDASIRFLMGNVILRIAPDPYPNESNISNALTDFGEYWRVNNDGINRNFAALLSGQNINSNSFSGIAWINQYCENGFVFGGQTAGSYSVNRIGSNAGTGFISQFLAHEIGHNLGSTHTHCYTPALDNCFNGETDCFSGTPVCPAGGKGTVMSYCHLGGSNGADCGFSNNEFHPTVIGLFGTRLNQNSPSCIAPFGSEIIFIDGFE